MERYSDGGITKSEVTVEFGKKNRVSFNYPGGKSVRNSIGSIIDIVFFTLSLWLLFLLPLGTLFPDLLIPSWKFCIGGLCIESSVLFLLCPPVVFSLILFWKYPGYLPKIYYYLLRPFQHKEVLEVSKLEGVNYTTPYFKNFLLHYKASGQFGKFLKKIEVRKMGKREEDKWWVAFFTFSRIPKEGRLRLEMV